MTALILAAGKGTRWHGLPVKQLLDIINGEPLIMRIVRQVKARGRTPIVVTHHKSIADAVYPHANIYAPAKHDKTCETLLSCKSLWGEHTPVLLGDTIYSKNIMDMILTRRRPITFFGDRWEIYALSFMREAWEEIEYGIQKAILHRAGRLRYLYRALVGRKLDDQESEEELRAQPIFHYMSWADWTTDIDKQDQYNLFIQNVIKKGRLDD